MSFAPSKASQFDWSEDYVVINGMDTKLQIAHFKLSHSRAFFLRTYLLRSHEIASRQFLPEKSPVNTAPLCPPSWCS